VGRQRRRVRRRDRRDDGAAACIILADYYLLAKGEIDVEALYREDGATATRAAGT
jgi:cytosine/uracil/thiamine/allantoin permease